MTTLQHIMCDCYRVHYGLNVAFVSFHIISHVSSSKCMQHMNYLSVIFRPVCAYVSQFSQLDLCKLCSCAFSAYPIILFCLQAHVFFISSRVCMGICISLFSVDVIYVRRRILGGPLITCTGFGFPHMSPICQRSHHRTVRKPHSVPTCITALIWRCDENNTAITWWVVRNIFRFSGEDAKSWESISLTDICSSTGIRLWTNNCIYAKELDGFHPCTNFNEVSVKRPLNFGHLWVIISQTNY